MPVARDDVLAAAADPRAGTDADVPRAASNRVWLKAELFQKTGSFKARRAEQARLALAGREGARRDRDLGGNHAQALAWGAAAEGIDCLVVMWRASEAKIAATRATAPASTSRQRAGSGVHPLDELIAEKRRPRAPVRRPARDRGPPRAARASRTRRGRDDWSLSAAGRLVAGIAAARPTGASSPSSRSARPRCTRRSQPVTRFRDAGLDRGRAVGPFAGEVALALLQEHGVESSSSRRRRSRRRFASSIPAAGCRAGCRSRPRSGACSGRAARVVSGGNVVPETASAILARR